MYFKKMFSTIYDHNRSMQERIFRLLTVIALVALAFAMFVGLIMGESAIDMGIMVIGFVVFSSITVLAIRFNKIRFGANLIAVIIIFFVLPLCFATGGGMQGGSPIWFVFCAVYICMVVYGWERYLFLISTAVVAIASYYVAYNYPQVVTQHTAAVAYLDSLASVILVSILICMLSMFETQMYVNEKKIAEKQKKEIEELNQAQNGFFTSMSHEIRTPINTIIGLNEMILREAVTDEVAEDARNIQSASKMLLQVVNDILDMSKLESGEMEINSVAYDVGEMLSEIVNLIWIRVKEKGLVLQVNVDPSLPRALYGDEIRIKQILVNLLSNAVKYTKEGTVTLSIQCKQRDDGKKLVIYSVTDTGMGIKKEVIPYLFTAFKRVDQMKNRYIEGTGLGLSIVKQFADLMGGEISVNSVYTKGSTFVLELPQRVADEEEIGQMNLAADHVAVKRKQYLPAFEAPNAKLLIVDDNDANLMVAQKLLRDTKIQIDTASSGQEALRRTLEKAYDLIFMDHLMPEMDGIDCLHALRAQTGGLNRETPVVALTANAGSDSRILYAGEGFDGYLVKPVSGSELEQEIIRILPEELVELPESDESDLNDEYSPVQGYRKKIPILVTTDSVCDFPRDMLEKESIPVMSYHVHTKEGIFLDGIETETLGLISYMEENRGGVRSDPPEMEEYEVFFAEQLTKAHHIVHITMSSDVSGGFQTATEAAQTFDNVTVIDSGHLSSGLGFLVMYANQLAKQDITVEELAQKIEERKENIHTSFLVNSTEYLADAGKIHSKIHMLCKALSIHPVFVMRKGRMKIVKFYFGSMDRVWRKYVRAAMASADDSDHETLFVTHAGLSRSDLRDVESETKDRANFKRIIYQKVSSALSVNCGPGTFGIFYQEK